MLIPFAFTHNFPVTLYKNPSPFMLSWRKLLIRKA